MKVILMRTLLIVVVVLYIGSSGGTGFVYCQGRERFVSKLTIYVDEGRGKVNRHIFIGLSNGQETIYRGFYPKRKGPLALMSLGGGKVKDDSGRADAGWSVKRSYNITRRGYEDAVQAISNWENQGRPWGINHHCGDFAETITKVAGVPIQLPSMRLDMSNRPRQFGNYLRTHGGTTNPMVVNEVLGLTVYEVIPLPKNRNRRKNQLVRSQPESIRVQSVQVQTASPLMSLSATPALKLPQIESQPTWRPSESPSYSERCLNRCQTEHDVCTKAAMSNPDFMTAMNILDRCLGQYLSCWKRCTHPQAP